MKKEIVAIGEALIDFIPQQKGRELQDVEGFERKAGGAPTNVAAAVAKLGGKASVITQVGKDAFGDYILKVLEDVGVGTDKVFRTNAANTALAFVSLSEAGERSFSFYRKPCADLLLEPDQIDAALFADCFALHFCSVDLMESPMKQTHKKAIQLAKQAGALISFDPNVRLPLFDDPNECHTAIHAFLPEADIVKVSEDELEFIFGTKDVTTVKEEVFSHGATLFVLTRGAEGASVYTRQFCVDTKAVDVSVVDTTGAGDSFIGAFLYGLAERKISKEQLCRLDEETCRELLLFANSYSAYTTGRKGAIEAMATLDEMKEFIKTH